MSIGFTMSGRIGRKEYITSSLIVVGLTYAAALALGFTAGATGNDAMNAIAIVVTLVGCVMQGALMVRRFHDLGKPGWHYWLTLVPFYNLYVGIVLLFTESAKGANQYGPEPAA
jgi:uncharacterized membrane protein YhaH (DUF805 family)